MSGKTIINLEIGRQSNESLQAITICFDGFFSMERAAQFYPGFKEVNETYWVLQRNKSFDERDILYEQSFENNAEKHLNNNGLDFNELFDKMY